VAPARCDRRNIAATNTDVGELAVGQSRQFRTCPRTLAAFVDGGTNAGNALDNPAVHHNKSFLNGNMLRHWYVVKYQVFSPLPEADFVHCSIAFSA
jgi:hypothetical protein